MLTLQAGDLPSILPHVPQQAGRGPGLGAGPRHAFAKPGGLLSSSSGLAALAQTLVLASLTPFPVPIPAHRQSGLPKATCTFGQQFTVQTHHPVIEVFFPGPF